MHVRVRQIFQNGRELGFALFAVKLPAEESIAGGRESKAISTISG